MKKLAKQVANRAKEIAAATGVSLAVASQMAWAEVPASVTAGIAEAVTDIGIIGALVLGVVIAIVAFAWVRRPIH